MIELNFNEANNFVEKFLNKNFNKINGNFSIKKIAGDASFRSYYRINLSDNNSFILMYAPVLYERIDHFIKIDKILCDNGFSAPKIFDIDEKNGYILLEDFGDSTFTRLLEKNINDELQLYKNACDVLIKINKIDFDSSLKLYSNQILFNELMLFINWYLKLINKTISLNEVEVFKKNWFDLFDQISNQKKVMVLRDYHADNLMLLNNQNNYKSIGILDFQDALIGSPAYDLVSLLDDIRRNIQDHNRQFLYEYFIDQLGLDRNQFNKDCAILSLQRNIKILGIFARLVLRDKKIKYLDYIDRVKYFINVRLNSHDEIFKPIANILINYI